MARASLATLIAEVRLLIADPAGASQVFTDDQIQEALDHTRQDVRYMELAAAASIAPGGSVTWLDYYAMRGSVGLGDWEDDAQVLGNTFAVLTPSVADTLVGHWTFAADTRPPVYLVAKTFDRHAAAADLCRRWAASLKLSFNFATDRQRFDVAQKTAALLALAATYDAKARVTSIQMVRSDAPQELWTRRNYDISRTSF